MAAIHRLIGHAGLNIRIAEHTFDELGM